MLVSKFFNQARSMVHVFTLMMYIVSSSIPVLALDSARVTNSSDKACSSEGKTMPNKASIPGWYAETRDGDFEIGLDTNTKYSGASSAYLKSLVPHPSEFGNLTNWFAADEYHGKRLNMSAWVKSELISGNAQLWLRIDGEWKSAADAGVFDNMDDRPIKRRTDWTQYSLVVDVPAESTDIVFGLFLNGTGQVWLDNVSFAAVSKDIPLTGLYSRESAKRLKAYNLDFEKPAQDSNEKTVAPAASPKSTVQDAIHEWYLEPKGEFEIKLDETQKHRGSRSAYIKSIVSKPTQFGQISQAFVPNNYLGKRLKMSAWAKSKLTSGTAHLWIRVDGEWNDNAYKPGCFDNMDDRPIKGETDWTQYNLIVDVPETSNHVLLGCFLDGAGEFWVDDFSLQTVGKECPLTGCYAVLKGCGKKEPENMNFEQNKDK